MFMQTSPDLRKKPVMDKPARETVYVPFYPDALPTMPESSCGVSFRFPENLYRPLSELRKVFRRILDGGKEEDFWTVDGWLAYEIDSRKICAVLAARSAETEAQRGHKADAKHAAAVMKQEKKEAERLKSRRRLWYQMAGKELPDDEQETAAAATDTSAADTTTTNDTTTADTTTTDTTNGTTDTTTTNTGRKAERKVTMYFNFFQNCNTTDEARARYYKLAQAFHTDTGNGDEETMKTINDQYAAFIGKNEAAAVSIPELPAGVLALPERLPEIPSAEAAAAEDFMKAIAVVVKLPGVSAELCGCWVWVSGETKPVKDDLKAAGFRFCGKKAMWYWHPADNKPRRRYRSNKSMDEIREKYGSRAIQSVNE